MSSKSLQLCFCNHELHFLYPVCEWSSFIAFLFQYWFFTEVVKARIHLHLILVYTNDKLKTQYKASNQQVLSDNFNSNLVRVSAYIQTMFKQLPKLDETELFMYEYLVHWRIYCTYISQVISLCNTIGHAIISSFITHCCHKYIQLNHSVNLTVVFLIISAPKLFWFCLSSVNNPCDWYLQTINDVLIDPLENFGWPNGYDGALQIKSCMWQTVLMNCLCGRAYEKLVVARGGSHSSFGWFLTLATCPNR